MSFHVGNRVPLLYVGYQVISPIDHQQFLCTAMLPLSHVVLSYNLQNRISPRLLYQLHLRIAL